VLVMSKPITNTLKTALAQPNPTVDDVASNVAEAKFAHTEAAKRGADLNVRSELSITGHPTLRAP
jgi:predicted amidohydrolase